MEDKKTFRTSLIGGYNKEDVDDYIAGILLENARLAEMEKKAQNLEQEISGMLKNQMSQQEKRLEECRLETEQRVQGEYEEKLRQAGERIRECEELNKEYQQRLSDCQKKMQEGKENQGNIISGAEAEILREKARKYDETYEAIKKLVLDSRIEAQIILTDARQKADQIVQNAAEQAKKDKSKMTAKIMANRNLVQQQAREELALMREKMLQITERFSDRIENSWEQVFEEEKTEEKELEDKQKEAQK